MMHLLNKIHRSFFVAIIIFNAPTQITGTTLLKLMGTLQFGCYRKVEKNRIFIYLVLH